MRFALLLLLCACAHAPVAVELIESEPVETTLDRADLRDAFAVWPAMFASARERVDLAEFYLSDAPGSRLSTCIDALRAAAARGVHVRVLVDAGFSEKYPETVAEVGAFAELRKYDVKARMGGVLHAKYFVVDGAEAFLGSQNFDWRSLTHIEELGVRVRAPQTVRALQDVFESDWSVAGGGPPVPSTATAGAERVGGASLTLLTDPRGFLPDEQRWDLPALVKLLDSAQRTVRVQVLTYAADFDELTAPLVRAAARGVRVQLLLSNWELRPKTLSALRQLDARIDVRILSIPQTATFVPFARVAHAKYAVVDGARGWIGTSNWERDYFYRSRNVALLVEGGAVPPRLDRFFEESWSSPYAQPFDRAAAYTAPRTGP